MYKDKVAKKLIVVARIVAWIGIILSVLVGLAQIALAAVGNLPQESLISGIVFLILGPVLSWLSGLVLATFGRMADDTRRIREKLCGEEE